MPLEWSLKGEFPDNRTPYIDWYWDFDHGKDGSSGKTRELTIPSFFDNTVAIDDLIEAYSGGPDNGGYYLSAFNFDFARSVEPDLRTEDFRDDIEKVLGMVTELPVPEHALPKKQTDTDITAHLPDDIPEETVLVGVIDTGIPLGHHRFRLQDGHRTRIISSWQQTASHTGKKYLDVGDMVFSNEINEQVAKHSYDGWLDEDAFNRELQLVQLDMPDGQRDLDFNASHGAHVADLAAGFDPKTAQDLDKNRIIAVNLPTQRIHGSGGNFLAIWAVLAVKHIVDVADALWTKNKDKYGKTEKDGYPLVINFSYGMHAGPKDGTSLFELAIGQFIESLTSSRKAPIRLVMPAGNDNLERGHARALMGDDKTWSGPKLITRLSAVPEKNPRSDPIKWCIQPGDHTGNFIECWLTEPPRDRKDDPPEGRVDAKSLTLWVTPPGQKPMKVGPLEEGQFAELSGFARVYRVRALKGQLGYVICVNRTESVEGDANLAPAGHWQIEVDYHGPAANCSLYIQSDQSGLVQSAKGRRSYFDMPAANVVMENGRLRDTFDYETSEYSDDWKEHGPMQIKGTLSALATSRSVISIGSFRHSDGRPAPFSASSDGNSYRPAQIEVIDTSLPSEIAPSLFGTLGSGAKDGSVAPLRGTSMAAGMATRLIAEELKTWHTDSGKKDVASKNWLKDQGGYSARLNVRPTNYRAVRYLKTGVGRIPLSALPDDQRIQRMVDWPVSKPKSSR